MSNAEPVSRKNTHKIGLGHFLKQYRINEQNAWKGSNYQSGAHTFNICSNCTSILRVDRLLYHCWEIEAKNKKISYAKPEFPKIYLLASNIVMIKGSLTYSRWRGLNSTNVLDEGLRIGEIGRRMNSKVNSVKQGGYESKRGCRT
jgi:hypothetical protein